MTDLNLEHSRDNAKPNPSEAANPADLRLSTPGNSATPKLSLDAWTDKQIGANKHNHETKLASSHSTIKEIGMTGTKGTIERALFVTGKGLLETPQGIVKTVEKVGPIGLATTALQSTAVGFGLKKLMAASPKVGEVAALALGASFLASTAPVFFEAYNKGLHAKTWKEMDSATSKFGQATGTLVLDSAIGFAGYHFGTGIAGRVATARAGAAMKPAESTMNTAGEVPKGNDRIARATDASPVVKREVSPEHTISMKELAEQDPKRFEKILEDYYPKLERAFPDASEIESMATYRDYLKDKNFNWDMLVLHDREGHVLGGIQSQVVDVGGEAVKKAVWGEHIWLDPEARTYINFTKLLQVARDKWSKTGSDIVFMEFNDRAKMNFQQQLDDAAAGLSPEARERIWGRVGLYVLGNENNRLAPYAQPAMGDGAPVDYLSLGFAPLKGKSLDGQTMSIGDYTRLVKAAHATIPDVNLKSDPTVLKYTGELDKLTARGETHLSYSRLRDTDIARITPKRFIDK